MQRSGRRAENVATRRGSARSVRGNDQKEAVEEAVSLGGAAARSPTGCTQNLFPPDTGQSVIVPRASTPALRQVMAKAKPCRRLALGQAVLTPPS